MFCSISAWNIVRLSRSCATVSFQQTTYLTYLFLAISTFAALRCTPAARKPPAGTGDQVTTPQRKPSPSHLPSYHRLILGTGCMPYSRRVINIPLLTLPGRGVCVRFSADAISAGTSDPAFRQCLGDYLSQLVRWAIPGHELNGVNAGILILRYRTASVRRLFSADSALTRSGDPSEEYATEPTGRDLFIG